MKGKIQIQDHDSCGTGVLFSNNNEFSHSIIKRALLSLANMKHRGALSYDGVTTDGCGILLDIDRKFFQKKLLEEQNLILPNNSLALSVTWLAPPSILVKPLLPM